MDILGRISYNEKPVFDARLEAVGREADAKRCKKLGELFGFYMEPTGSPREY